MQINMENKSGISVCRVKDDVDMTSSPDVRDYFEQLTREKKGKIEM